MKKVLGNLKKPAYALIMVGTSVLFFDLNYYFMSQLPGTRDNMCVVGAYLTALNVIFGIVLSILAGLMVISMIELFNVKRRGLAATSTLSAIGLFLGTFTMFCTLCTIPVITLFGLSLSLSFFTTYNLIFKAVSLLLILLGLYLINRELSNNCFSCKI